MSIDPPGGCSAAVHAYHLFDTRGIDLGRIEHPSTVQTGDTIALDAGRAAIVVARIEACTTSSVEALLEVVVFPAARTTAPRRRRPPDPGTPQGSEPARAGVAPATP